MEHSKRGLFIVFEGLDGSGQSTQLSLLTQTLTDQGVKVHTTKEPTNNIIGGLIRGQLTKDWSTGQECLQLLFAADRAHHIEREVIPALNKGFTVISDRYLFSSVAFGALDSDINWLKSINSKFLVPDLIFYLDIPAETAVERINKSRFAFELFEEKEKLAKIRENYKKLAQEYNFHSMDATLPREEIAGNIKEIVLQRLHQNAK